jgi:outer membrane protein assembly factor BamB
MMGGSMLENKTWRSPLAIGIAAMLVLVIFAGDFARLPLGEALPRTAQPERTWDFAAQFSSTRNPNGVWSYGHSDDMGATIELSRVTWIPPSYLLYLLWGTVCKNVDSSPTSLWGLAYWEAGQAGIADNLLPFGPKSLSDMPSDIKWTSPLDGFVSVNVRFTGQRPSGGSDAAIYVAKNGSKLYGGEIHGFIGRAARHYSDRSGLQPEQTFSTVLKVAVGDNIDILGNKLAEVPWSASVGIDAKIALVDAPGVVRGKVRASTASHPPVSGAVVRVAGGLASAVTGVDGSYSLTLPPGEYTLKVDYPGCEPARSSAVRLPSGETAERDLALGMSLVHGKVVEKGTGKPLIGATVGVPNGADVATLTDGTYSLLLPPGSFDLEARLLQHNLVKQRVTLTAGKTQNVEFELGRGTLYPWPKYAYDSRNSCVTQSPGPATNHLLWKFSTGTWPMLSSPARANGKIVAGASDGFVYALDEATGEKVWSYKTGDEIWSSPAIADGVVYIGSNDKRVYALDLSSGAKLWAFATAGEVRASAFVKGGIVYIGSQDGNVYALEAKSGKRVWTHPSESKQFSHLEVWSSATVVGDTVYISCGNGNVYALDAANGNTRWRAPTQAFVFLSTPKVADGRVYVAAHVGWEVNGAIIGLVYGFDAATGKQLWTYQTGAWLYSDPVVANGNVYVACGDVYIYSINGATGKLVKKYYAEGEQFNSPGVADGVIYIAVPYGHVLAIDEKTGQQIWTKVKHPFVSSAPLIADGRMYMTTSDSHILALDTKTGKDVWSCKTEGWIFAYPGVISSPAVVNGTVYIGSSDAKLYALEATNGRELWAYRTGGAITASPTIWNGNVYVSSMDGKVHAIDASSGKLVWATKICENLWVYDLPTISIPMWSSPNIVDGKLYVGSADGALYALNAETGSIIWRKQTGGSVTESPVVVNGAVYFGSNDGFVYALNADTGREIWTCLVGTTMFGSVTYNRGNLYVGAHDNRLYMINALSGAILERFKTTGWNFATPAVADNALYLGSAGAGLLLAFDAITGKELWTAHTMATFWACPAISGGNIYIGCNDGHMRCYMRDSGKVVWDYRTGHEIWGSTAVADGIAYVGSGDGNLYAIGAVQH